MSTIRQSLAAHEILENPTRPLGKSLIAAGYSPNTAIDPQQVIKSKGFQEVMDAAGLDENYLAKCLRWDIDANPGDRLGELTLAMRARGLLVDRRDDTLVVKLPTPILQGLETLPVVVEVPKDNQKHGFIENDTLPVVSDQEEDV